MAKQYETVIGLEVHVELATATKIFCGCSTKFGAAPNTHTCPVCTGMPGSLPVLNKKVVEYALALGMAANCEINQYCRFDGRTISTRTTRKTTRFPSYTCRSATTDIWRSRQKTARKPSGSTRCIWKRMPES